MIIFFLRSYFVFVEYKHVAHKKNPQIENFFILSESVVNMISITYLDTITYKYFWSNFPRIYWVKHSNSCKNEGSDGKQKKKENSFLLTSYKHTIHIKIVQGERDKLGCGVWLSMVYIYIVWKHFKRKWVF